MIQYHRTAFGLNLLVRVSGSAVYRAMLPGLLSIGFLVIVRIFWVDPETKRPTDELFHPYVIGVVLAGVSFLLVFRLQQAYARYWEACGSVHHMMSKWMDAVIHTGAYHMQCAHYDEIKPPSFFDYPNLNHAFLTRDREPEKDFGMGRKSRVRRRANRKSIESVHANSGGRTDSETALHRGAAAAAGRSAEEIATALTEVGNGTETSEFVLPSPLEDKPRLDGNWGAYFSRNGTEYATFYDPRHEKHRDKAGFASCQGGRTPPLFIQELAHLASLMNAVALATLRNDIEGAQSPLDIYDPGQPWPEVDPGAVSKSGESMFNLPDKVATFLGYGRSPENRTRYNASRPLPVLGGVSDAEIRFLQMARGAYAKTQLTWYWLSEYIIREHLAGSTGRVGPPIISRIIQFLGDGMIYYNHSRKIMFIPFPFPHAQLSVVYVLVTIPVVAFLMDQYADELWVASLLCFLTVTVFTGMHEVARELENPFRNVPNEIPLVTLQAQFNEALLVLYCGFHPDAYWKDRADHLTAMQAARASALNDSVSDGRNEDKESAAQPQTSHVDNGSSDQTISKLMEKMQEQSQELERLRNMVADKQK